MKNSKNKKNKKNHFVFGNSVKSTYKTFSFKGVKFLIIDDIGGLK